MKRFLIESIDKEEVFISEHPKSQLEIIATDYRPVAEVQFSKRSLDNSEVNFEEFIAVKGIKAQGNQLTTDKIKQVNLLESLPFEEPEEPSIEEVEVVDEEEISNETVPVEPKKTVEVILEVEPKEEPVKKPTPKKSSKEDEDLNTEEDGQITLF